MGNGEERQPTPAKAFFQTRTLNGGCGPEIDRALEAVDLVHVDLEPAVELEPALVAAADERGARSVEDIVVVAQGGGGHEAEGHGLEQLDEKTVGPDIGDDRGEDRLLLFL